MPNPKPAKNEVKYVKPTKKNTFIDKIFGQKKEYRNPGVGAYHLLPTPE